MIINPNFNNKRFEIENQNIQWSVHINNLKLINKEKEE